MRSTPLRFADLAGRRVGVWGVGTEGSATMRKLDSLGIAPAAVVDDSSPRPEVLKSATGGLEALAACEVVVKSPGISRYSDEVRDLEAAGVAVVGGLGLWLEEVGSERVVGVTGTKGKSTTVSVAGHLARRLGMRCFIGGNLGQVPWDPAPGAGTSSGGSFDLWVIEVSSYQATDLWSSPAVVAVTSLHPDHLDWHRSVENYYRDKLSLCGRPGARLTVANGADERLQQMSRLLRPGPRWVPPAIDGGTSTVTSTGTSTVTSTGTSTGTSTVTSPGANSDWTAALGLRGAHNVSNALIAAACLEEMGVAGASDPKALGAAAQGFHPLPHRLETVALFRGVEYVDDSLSTNVLPTIAAVDVFAGRPLALLAGGYDRGIDYSPLGEHLARRAAPTLVLTLPQDGERVRQAVVEKGCEAIACAGIGEAVEKAAGWAPAGGVVLLSPAAASYGLYSN
ncbi:MAG: UDP-N-acetylmuramoyl-L-alanine--D-glutamate ligase, partial [Acidimicrobiales bacterium]